MGIIEQIRAEIQKRIKFVEDYEKKYLDEASAGASLESVIFFLATLQEPELYVRVRIDGDDDVYYKDMYDAVEHLKESGKHGTAVPVEIYEVKP